MIKKLLYALICVYILMNCMSCDNKNLEISREYTGQNEKYQITVDSWLEYDGNKDVSGRIKYDEKIYSVIKYTIEYVGTVDFDNVVISHIRVGNNSWEANYDGEPDYSYLFKDNKLVLQKKMDLRCIDNDGYFVEITYDNHSVDLIYIQLASKKGEISDLNLIFD